MSDSFEVVDVTLTVTISNPVNAIIAQATATGTIIDTPLPQLGIQDATAIEGEDLEFTVIFLSDVEVDNVSFTCTTSIESGDTAETNDFTPVDMVISPSGNTATCSVPTARSHGHYELDDTLTVTISNPVNATIYQATATGTIIDTNDFPTLRWLYPSRTVEEDEPTINNFFCLVSEPQTLEGSFGVTLEVTGTATEGEDYNTFDTNVRVSNGQSQLCLPIRIVNDNDLALEDRETVIVRIVSSDASFVRIHANKHTAVLNIDEDTSDATITSLTGGAGHEGGQNNGTSTVSGQQFGNVNFRVRMDKQYFSEQCVDWQIVEGGQAKPGEDVPASGRTIIPPLADDFYIQVPIIDDNLSEQFGSRNYETFELEITGACGGISVPHFIAMGTIYDNEARPTVTIENATAVEGEDIVFVINIWPPAGVRTPVFFGIDAVGHYPPTDDTATKGVDFLAPHPAGFSILLPYGATTAEVRLSTIDDDLVEGTEEFGIGIHRGGSTNVGTPRTATGTILGGGGLGWGGRQRLIPSPPPPSAGEG